MLSNLKKLKSICRNFFCYTYIHTGCFVNLAIVGRWIENLSRGGLTIPSSALLSLCQTMETEFCRFHGNKINKCPKPIETLVEKIMLNKQPSRVLHYVCQLYVKVRFFNRLKFLNIQIKAKEASERIRNDTLIFIFVFVFISMISTSGGENL